MTIKVKEGYVRANGKNHGVGSELTFDKKEEKRLVGLGVAEYVEKPKSEPKGKGTNASENDLDNENNKDKDTDKDADNKDKNSDSNPDEKDGGPDTGHPDVK